VHFNLAPTNYSTSFNLSTNSSAIEAIQDYLVGAVNETFGARPPASVAALGPFGL
jgi:hypothetical protein